MEFLGRWAFLMSEVPLYSLRVLGRWAFLMSEVPLMFLMSEVPL